MFERYTERARRVLFFARYEASQLGSISIETEHVLLGLLREGKGVTSRIFARARMSMEDIRREIEQGMTFHEKVSTSVEIPFTPECKRVLQFAAQEADRLLHNYIGTEHLLLGILREEHSDAAKILATHGLTIQSAREQVVELASHRTTILRDESAKATIEAPPHLEIRVGPTGRAMTGESFASVGPTFWLAHGFTFRGLIAQLYQIEESSVDCPPTDNARYDITVVVPRVDEPDLIKALAREAIERFFSVGLTVTSGADGVRVSVVPAR